MTRRTMRAIGIALSGIGIIGAVGIVGRDDYLMQIGRGGLPILTLVIGGVAGIALAAIGVLMMARSAK